ncbi:MAG: acyl-CoA dehydrogenase [Pelagibacteraceae bacterium]|nr:acyl-CoA dehydrogenase [Pelagibacteraceae bacterium]|tara:strand:+ start:2315 stop:3520 length:1206 start_codon:yes stop_codon:yes gene_type:complete
MAISDRAQQTTDRLQKFMDKNIYPNNDTYIKQIDDFGDNRWQVVPIIEDLKKEAKKEDLWNLFLPESDYGHNLTNEEYAPMCEIMGRAMWSAEVFNCSAPDTGNMEVLVRYGTEEQKEKYLKPLLDGEIRSAFAMTEPAVASSDATNIQSEIKKEGNQYVLNGTKWWTSGAMDPRCQFYIFMGKTDPENPDKHKQQSMILVDKDTPGIKIKRHLPVFGFDDAPHGHAEIEFNNVKVPPENMLLGEGRGFEIAQGRLGPGRIHHCMRTIGLAEVALEAMCKRLMSRKAFGKEVVRHSVWQERIADARINIEMTRLLTLKAASMMDKVGNKVAKNEIAMIKVAAPNMALKIIDDAIQAFGGAGVTSDPQLARAYAGMRTLRLADGPDEVHRLSIARNELKKYL